MERLATKKYTDLRASLLRKHCSLRSWAIEHHFPLGSVFHAAKGSRVGPKSLAIRKALEAFLNE